MSEILLVILGIFIGVLFSLYIFRRQFYQAQMVDIIKAKKSITDLLFVIHRCQNKDKTLTDKIIQDEGVKFYDNTFVLKGLFDNHRTIISESGSITTIKGQCGDVYYRLILHHTFMLSMLQVISPLTKEYFDEVELLENLLLALDEELNKIIDKAKYGGKKL